MIRLFSPLLSLSFHHSIRYISALAFVMASLLGGLSSCTQEQQNQFTRSLQNITGTQAVLDVFSQGKVLYRIINIDKITTAVATSGQAIARPYRYGYGVMDVNMNYIQDEGEKVTYFEFSDYSTPYLVYQNPLNMSSPDASQASP